jgi:dihydropteroate synthase
MGRNFDSVPLPCIMGILNVTPDSFSDGGKFFGGDGAAERRLREIVQLSGIVDIGGESTKPGGNAVDSTSEWRRIEEILKIAVEIDGACVSVDTYHADTARKALKCGANVINDVCCTWHFDEMASVVGEFGGHLVVTHNSRNDKNFANAKDPVAEIIAEFEEILMRAAAMDFDSEKIIFDPGLGFGKTAKQNLEIFGKIDQICGKFSNPVLCGTSKKSFLVEIGGSCEQATLAGLTVSTTVEGFRRGCKIFRVHDVPENLAALNFARRLYE